MRSRTYFQAWRRVTLAFFVFCASAVSVLAEPIDTGRRVAVLVYHRFGQTAADSMTVRIDTFEAQLRLLRARGYRFVALRDVVDWCDGQSTSLPPKAVALTVDDGHRSVYDFLRPIALRDRLPITLFIYPSAISKASYALTWDQLRALSATGFFDIQSHTYWHPNFNVERTRRSPADFRTFAEIQFEKSRDRLEKELGTHVDLLAWPFGIVDDELIQIAKDAGYRAAFTLDGRLIHRDTPRFRLSRLLIVDGDTPAILARLLGEPPHSEHLPHLQERQP